MAAVGLPPVNLSGADAFRLPESMREQLAADLVNAAQLEGAAVELVFELALAAYKATLPEVSIADYGAVRNPAVDNGPAITAALAAANGRPVVIPPGEYGLGTVVRLPAGAVLRGYGATLHRLAGLGLMLVNFAGDDVTTTAYNGRGNIVIEGLTLDGHGDTVTDATLNTVTFEHCRNVTVRDTVFRRSRGYHALELNSTDGALVDNCRFEGFVEVAGLTVKEAIQIDVALAGSVISGAKDGTPAKNVTVRKSWFGGYGALPPHHVAVGSHAQSGFYDNISVVGCTMLGMKDRGVAAFWWRGGEIRGNWITVPVGSFGVRAQECYGLTIAGNYVVGPGAGASTQGINVSINSKVCRVVDNHVEKINEGIYVGSGTVGVIVAANTIRETVSYAVVADSANDVEITGNNIWGAGYTAGALGAIRITGTSNAASVQGNKARPHGAGTEVTAAVSVAATATNTWVFGNDFLGLAAAVSGTANTTGNRI